MAGDLYIKQGASLQLLLAVQNDDGTPYDLTAAAATLASQVRDSGHHLIATLTLTPSTTTGVVTVTQATDTWPTGRLLLDIKLTAAGVVLKSQTVGLLVDEAITA